MPRYRPQPFDGDDLPQVRRYIEAELTRLSQAIDALYNGEQEIVKSAPAKQRVGDMKFANGTGWNPGSGMGLYSYEGTSTASATWTKL